jgi:cyanophycinase
MNRLRGGGVGIVLLEGGSEFRGAMKIPDERALSLCGGASAPVRIIPAAAAPDGNQRNAGASGVRWFERLGATNVRALRVVDRASADRPEAANELAAAALIFLLGGFPGHLAETLAGSRAWSSMQKALRSGAVLAGSSAGAMVLCEHFFDPAAGRIRPGLNLIPGACVLPHHDRFGRHWAAPVRKQLPNALLIGIDEETGMLNDAPGGAWSVHGKGAVTVYGPHRQAVFAAGQRVAAPIETRASEARHA